MAHYILDEKGEVKEVDDLLVWGKWFQENGDKRVIARTEVGDYFVSTVFLGLDYNFARNFAGLTGGEDRTPILFETMVFENELTTVTVFGKTRERHKELDLDGTMDRYHTKEEAIKGHTEMVKLVEKIQKEKPKNE